MTVKLLTEHHLEFLGLTGGYTDSSESTLVKMPHCWKSHATAQINLATLPSMQRANSTYTQQANYDISTKYKMFKFASTN